VDGVYTTDPRIVPKAQAEQGLLRGNAGDWPRSGAKVLQVRSVELAMTHNMPTYRALKFRQPEDIDPHGWGTLICDEEDIMEQQSSPASPFPRRSPDHAPADRRQAGRRRLDLRARWPKPTSMWT
jgi:aspartokinase